MIDTCARAIDILSEIVVKQTTLRIQKRFHDFPMDVDYITIKTTVDSILIVPEK